MKIEDKENTQKLTEDISSYYDSEEDIVSKIQESIGVNFEDWASQITINEYNTLGKLRKFGKEHPEYRGDILKLKDKIRDIYGNAYMESYSKDETHEDKVEDPYLKEASYGGAFDIRDDQYFTRDDLDELIDYIETELNNKIVKDKVQIVDADMSDNTLHLEISTDKDGFWEEFNEKIDMRKIRVPRDLIKVYGKKAVEHFKDILESDGIEFAL